MAAVSVSGQVVCPRVSGFGSRVFENPGTIISFRARMEAGQALTSMQSNTIYMNYHLVKERHKCRYV